MSGYMRVTTTLGSNLATNSKVKDIPPQIFLMMYEVK